MAIDWSLLGPPVDMYGAVNRGFERGRQIRQRGIMERAFSDLAQNPEDTQAQASAFGVDPVAASQAMGAFRHNREAQRADEQRTALAGAIDPTGHIDTAKVRQVLAASGDINQLMNFDAAQAKNQGDISEQHLEQIKVGAKLLSGVQDEAGYQRALAMFKQLGYPLDDIPPNYDPGYVSQVVEAGAHLEAKSGGAPVVIDGVAFDRNTGQPLFESPYDRIVSGPGGIYRQPRIGIGRGGNGAPPAGQVIGTVQGGLPEGWVIEDDEGGAGSGDPRTFP